MSVSIASKMSSSSVMSAMRSPVQPEMERAEPLAHLRMALRRSSGLMIVGGATGGLGSAGLFVLVGCSARSLSLSSGVSGQSGPRIRVWSAFLLWFAR